MIEFVSGAIFGAALAIAIAFIILMPFVIGNDDDSNDWDPWGGSGRR